MTARSHSSRPIRLLALSRFISVAGSAAAFVAVSVEIFQKTGSTFWLAVSLLATFGLTAVLSPLAGVLVDAVDRRRLMIVCELLGACLFLALAVLDQVWALLAVALAASALQFTFASASGAAIPNLAQDDRLSWANSLVSLSASGGGSIGYVVGGLAVTALGPSPVFIANAISFSISAGILVWIRVPFSRDEALNQPKQSTGAESGLLAGLTTVRNDRALTLLTVSWVLLYFSVDIALVADLPMSDAIGRGGFAFGLFNAAWGIGQVVGAGAGRWITERSERRALLAGAFGVGAGYLVVAVTQSLAPIVAALTGASAADGFGSVAGYSLIQRRSVDEVRGRVFAFFTAVGGVANCIAFVLAGLIVGRIGPFAVYTLGGIVALIAGVVLLPIATISARDPQ